MADSADDLARLLADANHAVVLTGAGISTESGIPDFRSPGGTWEKFDPMEVASLDVFMREPARFWEFHRPRFDMVAQVAPNPAHEAVAELQRRGIVKALITQNIDGLHRRAGSDDVIEVHGSLSSGRCLRCDFRLSTDELLARADAADDGVPRCACGFQLKSNVVSFGEMLPSEQIDAAFEHAGLADVMLVIGSSLLVAPVSNLPGYVLANRGKLAILTEGETPYDARADIRMHSKAAETMPQVLAAVARLDPAG
jgi:NAD-dependent deacetylase